MGGGVCYLLYIHNHHASCEFISKLNCCHGDKNDGKCRLLTRSVQINDPLIETWKHQ